MTLIDLMATYSHGRRLYEIIQKHDPGHTIRHFPNQKKLIAEMTDAEVDEFFRYLKRVDEMVCEMAKSYKMKLVKADQKGEV